MTLLHDNDRPRLEDGVRTMLHRLAEGVDERPPAWDDLVRRRDHAPLGVSVAEVRNRRPAPVRGARRALAAAAVVLVAAAAAALVVDRPAAEPSGPATETISVVSPGDAGFDAEAAAAVWASGIDDPVAATTAYLAAMGVPTGAAVPPALVLDAITDATAVVDWTLPESGAGGTVYLRSSAAGGGALPTWTVVGAAASDVALADVVYDGTELSFTVARTAAGSAPLAVGVWVDGQPVSLGGEAVAQAGAAGISLGDLVDIGGRAGAHQTLQVPVDADDIVTLRVAHVVDGTVRSVTQMAVALPEADPRMAATGLPPVDAGGQASGQVDAGATGAAGTAEAEAEAGGSAGTELVPGVTVPALPELPPLPTLPTVPGIPAPTLPTPPASVPEPIGDALP